MTRFQKNAVNTMIAPRVTRHSSQLLKNAYEDILLVNRSKHRRIDKLVSEFSETDRGLIGISGD